MKASKHWGVLLDMERRLIFGCGLERMADDALHAIAHGDPLPRLALVGVGVSPAKIDVRAAEVAKLPQLRTFWLVENSAQHERDQAEDEQ